MLAMFLAMRPSMSYQEMTWKMLFCRRVLPLAVATSTASSTHRDLPTRPSPLPLALLPPSHPLDPG
jgi:hypothetical protein